MCCFNFYRNYLPPLCFLVLIVLGFSLNLIPFLTFHVSVLSLIVLLSFLQYSFISSFFFLFILCFLLFFCYFFLPFLVHLKFCSDFFLFFVRTFLFLLFYMIFLNFCSFLHRSSILHLLFPFLSWSFPSLESSFTYSSLFLA